MTVRALPLLIVPVSMLPATTTATASAATPTTAPAASTTTATTVLFLGVDQQLVVRQRE
jgi:hypothetical protein